MDIFSIITLFGGIALFLYGMSLMGNGLKNVAGNKMETILWKLSSTPLKGLLLGTFATAIIQSSAATTCMVIGFVNAGMMKVSQSIGVIMGAEIGTTMTGWLLTLASISGKSAAARVFSTSTFVPVLSVIGICFYMFSRRAVKKHIGTIILGFTVLMFGMITISGAVAPLKNDPNFTRILMLFSNPFLGILAGCFLTVIIQSCSAGVGILQALSITGALTFSACLPLILGINLGASTPVLFAMIGSNKKGKRAAMAYLVCNVLGILIISLLYYPLRAIAGLPFMDSIAGPVGIAILNTVMRVIIMVFLLPGFKFVEKLLYIIIKYDKSEDEDEEDINKLDDRALQYPQTALGLSIDATYNMARIAEESVLCSMDILDDYNRNIASRIMEKETILDKYEDKVGAYVMKLRINELRADQQKTVAKLLNALSDFERLGDHSVNLAQLATEKEEKKIVFSSEASRELVLLTDAIKCIVSKSIEAYCTDNVDLALSVEPLEHIVNILCDDMKMRHVNRLQTGQCTIGIGFIFNDILTNYERISDHCSNIAICMLRLNDPDFMPHEYAINATKTQIYIQNYEEYMDKYVKPIQITIQTEDVQRIINL